MPDTSHHSKEITPRQEVKRKLDRAFLDQHESPKSSPKTKWFLAASILLFISIFLIRNIPHSSDEHMVSEDFQEENITEINNVLMNLGRIEDHSSNIIPAEMGVKTSSPVLTEPKFFTN